MQRKRSPGADAQWHLGAVHELCPRDVGLDGVVPFGADIVTLKVEVFEFRVGDFELLGIVA